MLTRFTSNRYVIVSHGYGLEKSYKNGNFFIRFLMKRMILNAEYIQLVGNHLFEFVYKIGVPKNKILLKNSFLPPPLLEEKKIMNNYPDDLYDFIKNRDEVIIVNASSLVIDENKVDLYGVDMSLKLIRELKADFPNIGLIIAIANEKNNEKYLRFIKSKTNIMNIEKNVYFLTGQYEIWPLFKIVDLMIRPTNTDGYGISVAEAIYFDCPAIASDVSDRPLGTILFKTRDQTDLYNKAYIVLNNTLY